MNNLIRVSSVATKVSISNPSICEQNILKALKLCDAESNIIVFPSMSLCGASSYDLLKNKAVQTAINNSLDEICRATNHLDSYIVIGLPIYFSNNFREGYAVIHEGQVKTIEAGNTYPTVFSFENYSFGVIVGDITKQLKKVVSLSDEGCKHIVNISALPVVAGLTNNYKNITTALSQMTGCAITVCNGNFGESSSPYIYKPFCGTFLQDSALHFTDENSELLISCCDIDLDIVSSNFASDELYYLPHSQILDTINHEKASLLNSISNQPYLENKQDDYLSELFELQVQSVVTRLSNTGIKKCILAVSGGLDSTLALLVTYKALKQLGLPTSNLIGITMPCFGTTSRTFANAVNLIKGLNAEFREINIKASIEKHFEDIGHDINNKNTTYENAQARERTQILMDIGNTENALVIGTGDLSEEALGFCTFNGDHMASYNVNVCITKTLLRLIVEMLAKQNEFTLIKDTLIDILNTPVSPELLPPVEGKQQQKTEEILGDYIVHDFFLYYFIKYNMSPSKIYQYAQLAFKWQYTSKQLYDWLTIFIKRYISSQFKRSCAPDSAIISEINLSNSTVTVPSDATYTTLLDELNNYINAQIKNGKLELK